MGVGAWGFGVSPGVKFPGGLGEVMFGFLPEKPQHSQGPSRHGGLRKVGLNKPDLLVMLFQALCPVYLLLQKKSSPNTGLKQQRLLLLIVSVGQELGDNSAGWLWLRVSHALMVSQLQLQQEWGRGAGAAGGWPASLSLQVVSGVFYGISPHKLVWASPQHGSLALLTW